MTLLNNKGFTMIEMIIVIAVLAAMITISIPQFQKLERPQSISYFIRLLEDDFLYAQQLAFSKGQTVLFKVKDNEYRIILSDEIVRSRELPEGVFFMRATLTPANIKFMENGNIHQPGTFFIETPEGRYKFVYLLGKGRFYVEAG
ncbi:competence type IV pilus minor pilin ComGD [Alteribacillus sp. HJP-4]|uniref:competence type IV pilus minor pilin ComGD n=1 Tax=Alteribacillus sp. HJP-4 TaxID=2775394 RepID=UPI0035CCC88A